MIIDGPKEACGVFGIFAPNRDVARTTFYGLYALQHRGQESAGIATSDGQRLHLRTGMGLVGQVFEEPDIKSLPGQIAIGHTRYSTTGSSKLVNAQPIALQESAAGPIALGHNGNIVNTAELRSSLEEEGESFVSSTDSEVIAHLIAHAPGRSWEDRVRWALPRVSGAYALVILTLNQLIAARDPMGNRPLCVGRLGEGWVVASETCALDHIGAAYVREVEPGEAVMIDDTGLRAVQISRRRDAFCIFEYIYFARPDSVIRDRRIYPIRMQMGAELAREHPVEADVVIGVPDSATAAAIGYAQASGVSYMEGLIKNRYVNRTFIRPDQADREAAVQMKLNAVQELIEGRRVVVVDDSIVRGTTTPTVVGLIRRAGAKAVHVRICAPPIRHPCYFGVDMATRAELIAARMDIEAIRKHIGADSLGYLSVDGLMRAVQMAPESFCTACFTGAYPIPVQLELDKLRWEPPSTSA
jgi:amidophosphoribosyltransferase